MPLRLLLVSSGSGFTDIEFGLTVWTVVLFLLFAAALSRFGWKPLLKLIEQREEGVRQAVDGAQRANAEAQALLEKHQQIMREAARDRDEILKRTVKEAEQVRVDAQARARAETDQLLTRAKEQIEREKTLAIQELRSQVADLAVEAAAKIVTSSLTLETQRKLVNDFITGLPKVES